MRQGDHPLQQPGFGKTGQFKKGLVAVEHLREDVLDPGACHLVKSGPKLVVGPFQRRPHPNPPGGKFHPRIKKAQRFEMGAEHRSGYARAQDL